MPNIDLTGIPDEQQETEDQVETGGVQELDLSGIPDDRTSDLDTFWNAGSKVDPDTHAEDVRLSRDTGIPLRAVQNNKQQVKRIAQKPDWNQVQNDAPVLTDLSTKNPDIFHITKDDTPAHVRFEQLYLEGNKKHDPSVRTALNRAVQGAGVLINAAELGFTAYASKYTPQSSSALQELDPARVQEIKQFADMTVAGLYGDEEVDGVQMIDEFTQRMGRLNNKEQLVLSGFTLQALPKDERMAVAMALFDKAKSDGSTWNGFVDATEYVLKNPTALSNTLIEFLLPGGVGGKFAGAGSKQLVKKATEGMLQKEIIKDTTAATIEKTGIAVGVAGGENAAGTFPTTFANELDEDAGNVGDAAVYAGKSSTGEALGNMLLKGVPIKTPKTKTGAVLKGVGETSKEAFGGGLGAYMGNTFVGEDTTLGEAYIEMIMEVATAPVSVANELSLRGDMAAAETVTKSAGAIQTASSIKGQMEAAAALKLKERDPEAFREYLDELQKSNEDGNNEVFIDANQLFQSAQEQGLTPEQFVELVPAAAEQLESTMQIGGDIRLSMADILQGIAGTEFEEIVSQHVKTDPDEWSAWEAMNEAPAMREILDAQRERVLSEHQNRTAAEQQYQQVHDDIVQKMVDGGLSEEHANILAPLLANKFMFASQELGTNPIDESARYFGGIENRQLADKQTQLTQAQQSGYEGTDFNEANEWMEATEKGLDMSYEARYARAADMGFDVSKVLYHGTSQDFSSFDQEYTGPTIWFAQNPAAANRFSDGVVMPVYLRMSNPYIIENEGLHHEAFNDPEEIQLFINEGYDGVIVRQGSVENRAVFDPSQVRSVNAAFDPDQATSGNLLHQSGLTADGQGSTNEGGGQQNGIRKQSARALRAWVDSTGLKQRGAIGPVAPKWQAPATWSEKLSPNPFGKTQEDGRAEQRQIVDVAKENGFFFESDNPFFDMLATADLRAGEEHVAYIVGDSPNTRVIRSTKPGLYGHTSPDSPVDYLQRIEDYNKTFPHMQIDLIGVSQHEDGSPELWTVQPFVEGEEFATRKELDAALRKDGWFQIGVASPDHPGRYQHKDTGTIIGDVHESNILVGRDGVLLPIDVVVERLGQTITKSPSELRQGGENPLASFDVDTRKIILIQPNLSSMLHELGHLFWEMEVDMAMREGASDRVKKNVNTTLKWMGIEGKTPEERIATWNSMTLEEKRPHHEKFAESFEQYLFEGKAPSVELKKVFRAFRAWLTHVYKSLSNFLAGHQGAKLNDEMRGVMNRILASEDQIKAAEASRSIGPIFNSKDEAGMSDGEWLEYQESFEEAVQEATDQLARRSLNDMQWLRNVRSRHLRKLKRQAVKARKQARKEAEQQILSRREYRAWGFLNRAVDPKDRPVKRKNDPNFLDVEVDSLFQAIAKLGGINKEAAVKEWGVDPRDFHKKSGVFGKHILTKDGKSPDYMLETLTEHGYIQPDEHGKGDIHDMEDKIMDELSGFKHYSLHADWDVISGDARMAVPDPARLDEVGGRLNWDDVEQMYIHGGFTLGEKMGVYSGYEPEARSLQEPKSSDPVDQGPGNLDLFTADSVPEKQARQQASDNFNVRYAHQETQSIPSGIDTIRGPRDAAHVVAHIRKHAQETALAVVTDDGGKILEIIRHTKGQKDSSSVSPVELIAGIANVPGAKQVWLAHNHPSGDVSPSNADNRITSQVKKIADGTGLKFNGHIIVGTGQNAYWFDSQYKADGASIESYGEEITPTLSPRRSSVGLTERVIRRVPPSNRVKIENPAAAARAAKDSHAENGLILLDNRHHVIGTLSMTVEEMSELRPNDQVNRIFRALDDTNASAAILKTPHTDAAKNVSRFLNHLEEVRLLDWIYEEEGIQKSDAERGGIVISSKGRFNQPGEKGGSREYDVNTIIEKLGKMIDPEGLHPDTVADMFGFSSGDEMIRALVELKHPKEAAEELAEEIMVARHSELADPKSIERAADAAVHNEARVKALSRELDIMARAQKQTRLPVSVAKDYAHSVISEMRIMDIKPHQYAAAEGKEGKAAEKAMKRGDRAEALMHKRNQLLHSYTAKAAHEARDEVEKSIKYLKKFNKPEVAKKLGADYYGQIMEILKRHDLKDKSAPAIMRKNTLADWIKEHEEMGLEPVIDDRIRDEAKRTNYKELTMDELRGLVDAIKNIDHLGRLKTKLLTAKRNQQLDEAATEMAETIEKYSKGVKPEEIERNTRWEKVREFGRQFLAIHRKLASYARTMDGHKDNGAVWEHFIRPMNDAADNEARMREEATIALSEIFTGIKDKQHTKKMYIPAINNSLTYEGRIMVALNWGNKGNRQRLMDGDGWSYDQVQAILRTLDKADWDFVQAIWDYFDTFKPAVGEQQKRLTGIEPEWIEADEVETDFGTYRGGYIPAKYDSSRSTKSMSDEAATNIMDMWKAAKGRSKTRDSFTQKRAGYVPDRAMRKDFGVLFQHVGEVTHRLAWQDWLVDVNRLIRRDQFDEAVRKHYGPEVLEEMHKTIGDIAAGDLPAANAFERGINHLRVGTTITGLGWNLMTSLLQPLGITQSMVRVGPKWVAKGAISWITDPESSIEKVYEKSDFMRLRGKTMQRELNEVLNVVRSEKLTKLEASYFYLIQKAQMMADLPTWFGAYEKALSDPTVDERTAIELADQAVVDSQGGGMLKDLSRIQRGSPLQKIFTNFYSYFNVLFNLTSEATHRTDFKDPASVAKYMSDLLLLYILPATLAAVMRDLIKGGDDDEDLAEKIARENLSYMMGTMVGVRELSSVASGFFGYSGPAGTRFFNEFGKLGKQIEQGEVDEAFLKSLNNTAGIVLHYPAGQVQRFVEGGKAMSEGKTSNPLVLAGGYRD